jgi:hypothetical protein
MKKTLFLLMLGCTLSVQATIYLNEKFDSYGAATTLDPSTGWFVNPLQDSISAPAIELVKPDYGFPASVTNVATFAERLTVALTQKSRMDAIKLRNNGANVVGPRTLYAAMRLQVVSSGTGKLSTSWFMGIGDSTYTRVCGKVYIQATASPNTDFTFGVTKNTDGAVLSDPTLHKYGSVYLLVLKYKFMSDVAPLVGTAQKNDSVSLFVNPDLSMNELNTPTVRAAMGTGNDFAATHKLTFVLNQKGPALRIGSIIVSDSWSDLAGMFAALNSVQSHKSQLYYSAGNLITPSEGNLKIYSLQGAELFSGITNGNTNIKLSKGIYLARFKNVIGKEIAEKVTVW